jgi:hypothetical protein
MLSIHIHEGHWNSRQRMANRTPQLGVLVTSKEAVAVAKRLQAGYSVHRLPHSPHVARLQWVGYLCSVLASGPWYACVTDAADVSCWRAEQLIVLSPADTVLEDC